MPSPRKLCFVTDELVPLTQGELGSTLREVVLASLRSIPSQRVHLLVPTSAGLEVQAVRESLGSEVEVHFTSPLPASAMPTGRLPVYPPATAFASHWHAQSLEILLALQSLARSGLSFDTIEFPDRKGWAFCTLQEKRLGLGFKDTEIAVRLHGTMALLARREGLPLTREFVFGFELERKAILDAERVITPTGSLASLVSTFYGLPQNWLERVSPSSTPSSTPIMARPKLPQGHVQPRVSVIVTNFNLARYLPAALASVAASNYSNLEVVVVDDASTGAEDARLVRELEQQPACATYTIRVVRNAFNRGLAASRNIGIRAATGKYILPLDADDCIAPGFIQLASRALEAQPEFDVVVPTVANFETEAQIAEGRFASFLTFLGDAPTLGLVENRLSTATALLRRSALDAIGGYDETLTSYEDWSLYLRLVHVGHRFLVTNDVQFHYRQRPGSMVSGLTRARHLEMVARIYDSLPRPLPASVHPFAWLVPSMAATTEIAARAQSLRPLRYRLVDALNAAIQRVSPVHGAVRMLAEAFSSRRKS